MLMKSMNRVSVCAVAATCSLSSVGNASIVSIDSEFGFNTVTRDIDNGLDYLDLTLSTGISYNDMISIHLAAGGQFEGWRHATEAEYYALLDSAGIVIDGFQTGPYNRVELFIEAVGITADFDGDARLAQGITGTEYGGTHHFGFSIGLFRTFLDDGPYFQPVSSSDLIQDSEASDSYGHFLVRAVPAPGTLAFAGVFSMLCTRRRR